MGTAILTDLALRLRTNTAELTKGLARAKSSVKTFKKDTRNASREIKGAFSQLGGAAAAGVNRMSAGFMGLTGALGGSLKAVKGLTAGMSVLKKAIIATGIGAIVLAIAAAVGGLISYFKGSVDGAKKFASIMGVLKGILAVVKDVLIEVGRWLMKAFEDPQKAVDDLTEKIKSGLAARFEALVNMFKTGWSAIANGARGVANAIAGIFDEEKREKSKQFFEAMKSDLAEFADSTVKVFTGMSIEEIGNKAAKLGEKIRKQIEANQKIAEEEFRLRMKRADFLVEEAKVVEDIARLTDISSDKELTFLKRTEGTQKAIVITNALYAEKVKLAQAALDNQIAENKANETSVEDYEKTKELEKELFMIEKERYDKVRELKNRQEEIDTQAAAVIRAEEMKILAAQKARADSWADYQKTKNKETHEGRLSNLEKELADGLILVEEYEKRKKDLIKQSDAETNQNRLNALNASAEGASTLLNGLSELDEANKQRELKAAGDNADKKNKIEARYAKIEKKRMKNRAIMGAALAIVNALTTKPFIPMGLIAAGIAGVAGGIQVAAIQATPLAKGAIAYGPTNALIGEYPNARSNPEVVAPLDRLKSLIGSRRESLRFEFEGYKLVAFIDKVRGAESNY